MTTKVRVPPRQAPLPPPCPSVWIWLFAGILIGMVISFLVYLRELPSVDKLNKLEQQLEQLTHLQQQVTSQSTVKEPKKEEKNKFSFYDEFVAGNTPKPIIPADEPPPTADNDLIPPTTENAIPPLNNTPTAPIINPNNGQAVAATEPPQDMLAHMSPPPQGSSMLQVSSFRDLSKANELKAQLTQSGFHIQIESANVGGRLWYRVLAGPYQNQYDIDQAISLLEQQHLEVILRRY